VSRYRRVAKAGTRRPAPAGPLTWRVSDASVVQNGTVSTAVRLCFCAPNLGKHQRAQRLPAIRRLRPTLAPERMRVGFAGHLPTLFSIYSRLPDFIHPFRGFTEHLNAKDSLMTAPGSAPATLVPLPEQAGGCCKQSSSLIEMMLIPSRSGRIELADSSSFTAKSEPESTSAPRGDVERPCKNWRRTFPNSSAALERGRVFNTGHRPHIDASMSISFHVLQMATKKDEEKERRLVFEQVSLVSGFIMSLRSRKMLVRTVFNRFASPAGRRVGDCALPAERLIWLYRLIDSVHRSIIPLSERRLGDSGDLNRR